jgi:Ca2+-transporting ATPase
MTQSPTAPWSVSSQEILKSLEVNRETGLSDTQVEQALQKYGMNRLQQAQRRGAGQILIDQFKSPIIGLLAGAAVLSFVLQDWVEGIAIIVAILVNTIIGFVTELQATRSMEALQKLSNTTTKVRRDRNLQEIPSEELVPGDIVILDSGDMIAADLRIIEANSLNVNESSLTGESVPVTKQIQPLEADLPLADRHNMLYKGTAITQGSGEGVVVATGMKTELGRISELTTQGTQSEQTPLEKTPGSTRQTLNSINLTYCCVCGDLWHPGGSRSNFNGTNCDRLGCRGCPGRVAHCGDSGVSAGNVAYGSTSGFN